MNWTDKIAGCFGESDLIFAGHALEEDRAFDLLGLLRKEGVRWVKARAEFEAYLESKDASSNHIAAQLKKLERFFQAWLRD